MIKNKKITRSISAGMYVLSTDGAGCMVDTVMQVSSGDPALISVAVNKNNYTNEMVAKNGKFGISVLGMSVKGELIKTFGFNSSRDINKFEKVNTISVDGIEVIKDSIGYMICEVVDTIDADTHTIFIGKLIEADKFSDEKPMTYNYYQENKNDIIKVETEKGKTAYVCTVCGYVYYGEELPKDFVCPVCGVSSELFERKK
ncbi:MAG: flavin reductase [Bacilli bacterium]